MLKRTTLFLVKELLHSPRCQVIRMLWLDQSSFLKERAPKESWIHQWESNTIGPERVISSWTDSRNNLKPSQSLSYLYHEELLHLCLGWLQCPYNARGERCTTKKRLRVCWNRGSHRGYPNKWYDIHAPSKTEYRKLEQELMINQLQSDPKKIPQPTRDDMVRMLFESIQNINVDIPARYKALWLTSALDGSED